MARFLPDSHEFARRLHEDGLIPDPVAVKSIDIHADADGPVTITCVVFAGQDQLTIVRNTLDELRRREEPE